MYDLIDESGEDLRKLGYKVKKLEKFDFSVASLSVKDSQNNLNRGLYFMLNCPYFAQYGVECYDFIINQFKRILSKLITDKQIKTRRVLIVGLGNPDIQADRLGKEVFDNIEIAPLKDNSRVFKFCPNIFFLTGISTAELIRVIVEKLNVDFCILIDSLTTNNIERIGCSFQFTNSGITPGSGVNRFGRKVDKEFLGVECCSIGVPFMIFSSSICNQDNEQILTLKDVGEQVKLCGYLIAKALNRFLF